MAAVLGRKSDVLTAGSSVSVHDTAKIHVLALDPKIEGNQNFITAGDGVEGVVWEDALEIVKRKFPEAVKSGVLPLGGKQPTRKVRVDAKRTEEVFGIKFEGLEEQVESVVGHYLKLVEVEAGA